MHRTPECQSGSASPASHLAMQAAGAGASCFLPACIHERLSNSTAGAHPNWPDIGETVSKASAICGRAYVLSHQQPIRNPPVDIVRAAALLRLLRRGRYLYMCLRGVLALRHLPEPYARKWGNTHTHTRNSLRTAAFRYCNSVHQNQRTNGGPVQEQTTLKEQSTHIHVNTPN